MGRLVGAALLALSCVAQAAVFLDEPANTIWVVDYPFEHPCTMDLVLTVDRANGWERVTYDETSDSFTVRASLHIGANHGTDTYFQLGSKRHPNVTLVVHGDVHVRPSWVEGQNPPSEKGRFLNRLTMGDRDDRTVSATIKIASDRGDEHSFYVGAILHRGRFRPVYSGQLHMHNSVITALVQDGAHALGAAEGHGHVYLSGESIHLFGSRISWVKNVITSGLVMHLDTRVENCVFEHGKIALYRYKETSHKHNLIRGCTFRHCETALHAPNSFALFSDCKFEDNDHNWVLTECRDLVLIDCEYDIPKKGNVYGRTDQAKRRGWYPLLKSRRHIVVEVVDEDGKPVVHASITVPRKLEGDRIVAVTGQDGTAGRRGGENAILLTDVTIQVTDDLTQPDIQEHTYDISVTADGFHPGSVLGFRPRRSWGVTRVVLRRKE